MRLPHALAAVSVAGLIAHAANASVLYSYQERWVHVQAGSQQISAYAPDFAPWSESLEILTTTWAGGRADQTSSLNADGISLSALTAGYDGNLGSSGSGAAFLSTYFVVTEASPFTLTGEWVYIPSAGSGFSTRLVLSGAAGPLYSWDRTSATHPYLSGSFPFEFAGVLEAGAYQLEYYSLAGAYTMSGTGVSSVALDAVLAIPSPGWAAFPVAALSLGRRKRPAPAA